MAYELMPIKDWSDVADFVAVLSFPVFVGTIIIGVWQIVSQLKENRREASFEVYLQFTERFRIVSELRRLLNARFDSGDKSVNYETISNFYSQYWILQINQWEMFRANLIPVDVYANWLCYTHDNMVGPFALHYYDERKAKQSLSAKDAFREIAVRKMLRSQTACRDFFIELAAIPHPWSPGCGFEIFEEPQPQNRRSAIETFLLKKGKAYRASNVWKLN